MAGVADQPCTYLCGNSLGLLPKRAKKLVEEELEVWGTRCASHISTVRVVVHMLRNRGVHRTSRIVRTEP